MALPEEALPLPLSAPSTWHLLAVLILPNTQTTHILHGAGQREFDYHKVKPKRERVGRRPIKLTPSSLIFSLGSNLPYLLYAVSRQDRCKFSCFKTVQRIDCSQCKVIGIVGVVMLVAVSVTL